MTLKKLENVTLLIIDCVDYDRARLAFDHCQAHFEFGDARLLTHFPVNHPGVQYIPKISSINEYNDFMIYKVANYFTTEFVMIAQHDGFIWHPEMWDDDFLKYDYIGAPWAPSLLGKGIPKKFTVGNGGFSIRSKRLQDFLRDDDNLTIKYADNYPEDVVICQINRAYLEKCGFTFAPVEHAMKFSWECGQKRKSFGVHARVKLIKGESTQ
jgi:hypothetical protein